jgi:hypothetical protein
MTVIAIEHVRGDRRCPSDPFGNRIELLERR